MFHLDLLGGARISGPAGPLEGRINQRRQLALLAYLALQDRATSRDRLLAVFWPDTDTERARHALSDAIYLIRKSFGDDALHSVSDDVALDPAFVGSDVRAFRAAIAAGDFQPALELYLGPFLEGFHLTRAPAFEAWLQSERDILAQECVAAAEALATQREYALDFVGAVAAWRRAAALEPHNSRIALRLIQALEKSSDRAGALRFATLHRRLVEAEFGIAPPAEFVTCVTELSETSVATELTAAAGHKEQTHAEIPADTAEDAAVQAISSGTTGVPHPRRTRPRFTRRQALTFLSLALILPALVVVRHAPTLPGARDHAGRTAAAETLNPDLVVVLPFRAAGLHRDLTYLREGMVDLLAAKLTGEDGGPRAVPPNLVLSTHDRLWKGGIEDTEQDVALAVARELGAGLLLQGSLVGIRENLSIQTMLIDVQSGRVSARVQMRGTERELHDLVDRLVGEFLSRIAREEEHRLAHLTSTSLPALRVFLAARATHRRGNYEEALRLYGLALDLDTTFALAGLGTEEVGGWVGGSAPITQRGSATANKYHHRLSERDRVGRFGRLMAESTAPLTTRRRINEIEDALRRYPDHARLWYLRGDQYLHYSEGLSGTENWAARARESFERAIELDANYADPVHHLATLLMLVGDTAALRELTDRQLLRVPEGPVADYLRWLGGEVVGPPFRAPPFDSMHTDATLRWIGIVAQDYGVAIRQGALAVGLRLQRPGIRDEHLERRMGALAYALNGGKPVEALRALRSLADVQPDPDFQHRIAVLTALFAEGNQAAAAEAARALGASRAVGPIAELNDCIVTLWQLRQAPSRAVRPKLLSETQAFSADSQPWAEARRVCALVRDAQWLLGVGSEEAPAAVDRLDRLLDLGPVRSLVDNGHVEYVHVAVARLHQAIGKPHAARAALRRRTRYNGWQPYLATMLREEGRLAAELGDDVAARRAYSHYLEFRTDAEPALQQEVDEVRAALLRVSPSPAAVDR